MHQNVTKVVHLYMKFTKREYGERLENEVGFLHFAGVGMGAG